MSKSLHKRFILIAFATVLMFPGLKAQETKLDWLEDQPGSSFTTILTTPLSGLNVYPKLNSGVLNTASVMNAQELACFDVVISKAITTSINAIAGSQDDRTPVGVHEGLSCNVCHKAHSNDARNSCVTCPPAISNCKLDVVEMNTTYSDPKSKNNIHFVACTDCHAGKKIINQIRN